VKVSVGLRRIGGQKVAAEHRDARQEAKWVWTIPSEESDEGFAIHLGRYLIPATTDIVKGHVTAYNLSGRTLHYDVAL